MIKWQTKTGKEVKMWIETSRENLADHTVTSKCYNLRVEIDGIGDVGPVVLDGDIFRETLTRTINGKVIKLAFPACPEAKALFAEYRAEVTRRLEQNIKAEQEYEIHYNRVMEMMSE